MSEFNHLVLSSQEINDIIRSVPIGEPAQLIITKAQFDLAIWGIVDWMFTHETDGKMTSGGKAWAARLTQELEDGGFTRPSS